MSGRRWGRVHPRTRARDRGLLWERPFAITALQNVPWFCWKPALPCPFLATGDLPLLQAIRNTQAHVLVPRILAAGAIVAPNDVATACRMGETKLVDLLLEHASEGVLGFATLPHTPHRRDLVAVQWRPQSPMPPHIAAATLEATGTPWEWKQAFEEVARASRAELWAVWCASPSFVSAHALGLLEAAARCGWREGVESVLAACPDAPQREQERPFSPVDYPGCVLANALSYLRQARARRPAWAFFDRLLAAGFGLRDVVLPGGSDEKPGKHVPLLLYALEHHHGSLQERRRLIRSLVDAGADIEAMYPGSSEHLGHSLAALGDGDTLSWVRTRWPGCLVQGNEDFLGVFLDANPKPECVAPGLESLVRAGACVATPEHGANLLHRLADRAQHHSERRPQMEERQVLAALAVLVSAGARDGGLRTRPEYTTRMRMADHCPDLAPKWSALLLAPELTDELPCSTSGSTPRPRM